MSDASRAISLYAVRMRVTRLGPSGAPLVGPDNMYVTDSFVRVDYTPTYNESDAITKPNGRGTLCLNVRPKKQLTGVEMTVEICDDDPMLSELLGGGTVLTTGAGADVVGYQLPLGDDPETNGVSVEVWTEAWAGDSQVADLPWFHYVFPKTALSPTERTLAAEPGEVAFEGTGGENREWGEGPAGDWTHSSRAAMQFIRTSVEPPAPTNGYVPVAAPAA